MKIAITGPVASGKSTLLEFFSQRGYKTFSADTISHILLEKRDVKRKVIRRFGRKILGSGGKISRRKLGDIVFENAKDRIFLEKILHPLIRKEVLKIVKLRSRVVLENSLLFEMKMEKFFDFVICLKIPRRRWLANLRKRKISPARARAILRAQMPEEEKRKRSDFVIKNDASRRELKRELMKIVAEIEKNS